MKDIIRLNEIKPLQAEGRCTIELTDPITGKVKERVGGKNMVFPETLMVDKWWDVLSNAYTVLGDDDTPSSLDFPYMRGKPLGYGIPSTAGSGLYQGAYNSSNQFLKKVSDGKLSWKFQYDFTAPQSLGTIKAVSLTRQFYNTAYNSGVTTQFYTATNSVKYDYFDGRYGYIVGVDGVVEIADMYSGGVETINISATVGSTGRKSIFIDKATGAAYVLKSIANDNHTLYKFTDKTFLTLVNSYSFTSIRYVNSIIFFVKGNYIYVTANTSENKLTKIDYTTDTVVGTIPIIGSDVFGQETYRLYSTMSLHINDNFIMFLHERSSTPYRHEIFDLANEKFVAGFHLYNNYNLSFANHFYAEHPLPCYASGQMAVLPTAFTNYVLPTPVEKTNDKGMTVTYELDVYW